jgi:hypothetical protein
MASYFRWRTEDEDVVNPRSVPDQHICTHENCQKGGGQKDRIYIKQGPPRWYGDARVGLEA